MRGDLFRNGTATEIVGMLLLICGIGFVLMVPLVWIFGKTLALKERPERRAFITAVASYVIAALAFMFVGESFISAWFAPFVPLPGAIIIYLWLLNTYRKGWIDDHLVPEGTKLENSDWRFGLLVVVSVIVVGAIKGFARWSIG